MCEIGQGLNPYILYDFGKFNFYKNTMQFWDDAFHVRLSAGYNGDRTQTGYISV